MKYKVGDEVIIRGKILEVYDNEDITYPYRIKTILNSDIFWYSEQDLSPAPEFEWGEEVYVSDDSVQDALTRKKKDLFVKYCCSSKNWDYIVKIPKEETKPVTLHLTDEQLELIKKRFNIG